MLLILSRGINMGDSSLWECALKTDKTDVVIYAKDK